MYILPTGDIELNGLAQTLPTLKDYLKNLILNLKYLKLGFKSAVEPLLEKI